MLSSRACGAIFFSNDIVFRDQYLAASHMLLVSGIHLLTTRQIGLLSATDLFASAMEEDN